MPIDAQIPMSGNPQPSAAQLMQQGFAMSDMVEKKQEQQQQKQDREAIQGYLKQGGNMNTPEGLDQMAEWAKQNTSFNTYQTVESARQDMKANEAKHIEAMAKLKPEILKAQEMQHDVIGRTLEETMAGYDQDLATFGKQEADRLLGIRQQKAVQSVASEKMPDGTPLIDPNLLKKLPGMNRAEMESTYKATAYGKSQLKSALDMREKEQNIKSGEALEKERLARAKALKEGEGGGAMGVNELESAGAQIAHGMPLTQVIPGMSKTVQAKREKAREEAVRQIMEETPGMTYTEAGIELADRNIDYAATRAGKTQTARTTGATEANIVMASSEAKKMVAIVKDIATKMDLSEYPSINSVQNAVSKGTGGTNIVKLNAALNGLTNTYARAINPKGVPTVEDKKEARIVINNAMSHGQTLAALNVMEQEMDASLASPEAARKVLDRVRKLGTGDSNTGKSTAVPHETLPKGMPEGSKQAGHTPDGKPVWKAPNGKMYVEN